MIYDLNESTDRTIIKKTEVCIVGAGTAGIFLANQLQKKGINVIIIEAGDSIARSADILDIKCEQKGLLYSGAESGRSFGLGGTSVLWGGQMIPLAASDFSERQEVGFEAWPISYDTMAKYLPIVAKELGLNSYEGESKYSGLLKNKFKDLSNLHSVFNLRLSQWLPFKMRNFANAFTNMINNDRGIEIWLNSNVVKMRNSDSNLNQKIDSIVAKSPNGKEIVIEPSIIVVCAGALESTRLLLQFDEDNNNIITKQGSPIGRYFSDHLSVTCGKFVCYDWKRFNMIVAPIFEKGIMRTPRLELNSQIQKQERLTSAFAHFTFSTHGDTGFDVVRNILRRRQGEQQKIGLTLGMFWKVISDVSAMAWWRGIYKRLWIPRQADLMLQVDIEQLPNPDSRLYLSEKCDRYGRKNLVIDWRITKDDFRVIRKVASFAADIWNNSGLNHIADLHLSSLDDLDSFRTPYDVYHPTGSLRMGNDPKKSVVNSDLKLWSTENCFVTTTAVFPSAGSANPGMTHLALTARLAEHISKLVGQK